MMLKKMQSQQYFASIDGLRTLACLGIVGMHINANLGKNLSERFFTENVLNFAGDFVLLFMMISAFSLCCGYLPRFQTGNISIEKFYGKRYRRILPFFSLLTIIDVLFCAFENHFQFTKAFVGELWEAFANLTLLFGLVPGNHINVIGVGWFLGVIFLFYLLFPFYSTLFSSKKKAWLALVISIIWNVAIEQYFAPEKGAFSGKTCILVVAPYFISAGIIYMYKDKLRSMKMISMLFFRVLVILYSIAFFLFPDCRFPFSNLLLYTFWLIYAITQDQVKRSLLNNPIMSFISRLSMEIYLSHMLFFRVIEKIHLGKILHNEIALYFVTFSLVLAAAILFSLVWKRFESHFLKER